MKTVYLSGKYTDSSYDKIAQHILLARIYAGILWEKGFGVFCPHLNTAHFDEFAIPYDQYMEFDLKMVEALDCIYMLPNWKQSRGARIERAYAFIIGKPIFYSIDAIVAWGEKCRTS